jgi:hypothetical protein
MLKVCVLQAERLDLGVLALDLRILLSYLRVLLGSQRQQVVSKVARGSFVELPSTSPQAEYGQHDRADQGK